MNLLPTVDPGPLAPLRGRAGKETLCMRSPAPPASSSWEPFSAAPTPRGRSLLQSEEVYLHQELLGAGLDDDGVQ